MRPILSTQSRIIISAILLAIIIGLSDWGRFLEIIGRADGSALVLMFGAAVVERVFSAYRWYVLVQGKRPSINFYAIFRITFISNFLGLVLPGSIGSELVRINGLARLTGDLAMSFTSVLVERCLGLLALTFLVLVGLAISPAILPVEISLTAGVGLAVLSIGLAAMMNGYARAFAKNLFGHSALRFIHSRLDKLYAALDEYRMRPGLFAWAVVLAVAFQLVRVALYVVGAWALVLHIPAIYFLVFVPVAVIAQLLPISFGGLGIRELSLVALLSLVNVNPEAAISLSLLAYLMRMLAGALPGAILYTCTRTELHTVPSRD
jgi:uncharacterized protein (TIRG00374 family)